MNKLSDKTCICCSSDSFRPHLPDLLTCAQCGHVIADLDFNQLNLKDIYSIDYFEDGEYLDYINDKACFEKNFQKRLSSVRRHQASGRLLEIGSASGFFLNLAKQHFETAGYEICEQMADYARKNYGLNIKSVDFLQEDITHDFFDAAVMWDCIEHLSHPEDFINKINKSLKTGGVIALTTGDIGSFVPRLQGRKWRLIHPPTHLHYFTRHSMSVFLKNHGFEILSIQYPGFYRSLGQMFYGLNINKNQQPSKPSLENSWEKTPVYLNLFDIMLVIARKIEIK